MDSRGQDCEDEFFESLQDIPSTSGSESSEEDGSLTPQISQMQISMGRIVNGEIRSNLCNSRYEIWKNDPGTIPQRRHRLLIEMGLGSQPTTTMSHASYDSTVISPNLSTAQVVLNSWSRKRCQSTSLENNGFVYAYTAETTSSEGCKAGHCSIAQDRSLGRFSETQQNSKDDGSGRFLGPCTGSAVLRQEVLGYERLMDKSGAVLRSFPPHSDSNPAVGAIGTTQTPLHSSSLKSSNCSSVLDMPRRWVVSHSNSSDSVSGMNQNGTLPADSIPDCVDIETIMRNGRQELPDHEKLEGDELMRDGAFSKGEVVCRIKNLDSGKEFIVHELGRDGSWNKLKELDTGRELTLEEFENTLGLSPIVREVMRRERAGDDSIMKQSPIADQVRPQNKKRGWLKTIKGVVRRSMEISDQSVHGSHNDDSSHGAADYIQETPLLTGKRIKVHAHKKPVKEFSELHMQQEFQAHQGAIWTMKFSLDGCYLASAGQDRIVCVWEVVEQQGAGYSPDIRGQNGLTSSHTAMELQRSSKGYARKKNAQTYTHQPSKLFLLSKKPKCLFQGHTEDILDLSWSRSQFLLSSSMDKTVRLWHISCRDSLRVFKHHDYVTCIQFNPVADGHFISGSLDGKVRIWSIQDHRVVDWVDLSEMVTAAAYTPDGQGAAVGSYKGTCRFYNASDNKLQLTTHMNVQSKKGKKTQGKKITGFQFISGDCQKVLITSSDSRIRVFDGPEIICKYKGFRNTKSQISASLCQNGRYIICASEDSRVYIWSCDNSDSLNHTGRRKEKCVSYETFNSQNVLVAVPWPGMEPSYDVRGHGFLWKQDSLQSSIEESGSSGRQTADGNKSLVQAQKCRLDLDVGSRSISFHDRLQLKDTALLTPSPENGAKPVDGLEGETVIASIPKRHNENMFLACNSDAARCSGSETSLGSASATDSYLEDDSEESVFCRSASQQASIHSFFSDSRGSATWPEEQLPPDIKVSPNNDDLDVTKNNVPNVLTSDKNSSAWGLVIVTAGLGGEIRTFQNYSFPSQL